ncbi:MAG: hypothetical protein AB9891_05880 [Anaerolineaceae bacterium]
MFTIRCTSKLFPRTGLRPETDCPPPATALGDWYANLIFIHRAQYLLFVSEASLLAVITPAREARALRERLTERLPVLLDHIQIPHTWIEAEMAQMGEAHFARTASRQVLGAMTDFVKMIKFVNDDYGGDQAFDTMSFMLACPFKPIDYRTPDGMTRELLEKRYGG